MKKTEEKKTLYFFNKKEVIEFCKIAKVGVDIVAKLELLDIGTKISCVDGKPRKIYQFWCNSYIDVNTNEKRYTSLSFDVCKLYSPEKEDRKSARVIDLQVKYHIIK